MGSHAERGNDLNRQAVCGLWERAMPAIRAHGALPQRRDATCYLHYPFNPMPR